MMFNIVMHKKVPFEPSLPAVYLSSCGREYGMWGLAVWDGQRSSAITRVTAEDSFWCRCNGLNFDDWGQKY